MGILSIKIRIGDRDYPMKVDESEEEILRTAGKALNEKLKAFKEQYQIEDRQDLLAMVAFDSIVQQFKNDNLSNIAENRINDKIGYLNTLISKSI
jgi:cell division protein ZapA